MHTLAVPVEVRILGRLPLRGAESYASGVPRRTSTCPRSFSHDEVALALAEQHQTTYEQV